MSNTYFENGILKLRNVVVKLSNQGEIEIWDDDEIYQLKRLSNKFWAVSFHSFNR